MNDLLISKSPMQKAAKLTVLAVKAKELRDQLKVITDEMSVYKEELLKITQELDVYTLKTGSYTISRARRITPVVEDFKSLRIDLAKQGIPFETEEVFKNMDMLFKDAIKQEKKLKGLSSKETQYISVRIAKEAK